MLKIPKDLQLDAQDGDEVEILLKARVSGDALEPLSLDGIPIEAMKEKDESAEEMPEVDENMSIDQMVMDAAENPEKYA